MCIVNAFGNVSFVFLPHFNATKVTQNKHENEIRFIPLVRYYKR